MEYIYICKGGFVFVSSLNTTHTPKHTYPKLLRCYTKQFNTAYVNTIYLNTFLCNTAV